MTIEEMRGLDALKTYKELEEAKQLVKELEQRMKDDGEYIYILGTRNQDYREALLNARNEVKQLKETIKELQEVNEYLREKCLTLEYGRTSK